MRLSNESIILTNNESDILSYSKKSNPSIVYDNFFTITCLRALSVIMVLANHMSYTSSQMQAMLGTPGYAALSSGVQMFFIISGFVVVTSISNPNNKTTPQTFFIRRAFRLYPGLLILTVFSMAVNEFFLTAVTQTEVINSLGCSTSNLLLNTLGAAIGAFHGNCYSFSPAWSLSLEFRFYGVVLLILILETMAPKGVKIQRWLVLTFAAALLIYGVLVRIMYATNAIDTGWFNVDGMHYYYDFFGMGALIALFPKKISIKNNMLLFFSTTLLVITVWILGFTYRLKSQAVPYHIDHDDGWGMLFTLLAYGAIVFICVSSERESWGSGGDGKFSAFTGKIRKSISSFVQGVSDSSYLIYLLQFPFFVLLYATYIYIFPKILLIRNGWEYSQMLAVVFIFIPFCFLIHKAIERKMIRIGKLF